MNRCVVDTNVPIVANGRADANDPRPPSIECRESAVTFLRKLVTNGTILLDTAGDVLTEYRRYLDPRGQPGVGDRFYLTVLMSHPARVERVELPRRDDGEYADLPQPIIDAGFDPSDRKFAALGIKGGAPVFNATDSDWIEHGYVLAVEGVELVHLCGCDPDAWFAF